MRWANSVTTNPRTYATRMGGALRRVRNPVPRKLVGNRASPARSRRKPVSSRDACCCSGSVLVAATAVPTGLPRRPKAQRSDVVEAIALFDRRVGETEFQALPGVRQAGQSLGPQRRRRHPGNIRIHLLSVPVHRWHVQAGHTKSDGGVSRRSRGRITHNSVARSSDSLPSPAAR